MFFLIGMPASGKSTLARKVKSQYKWQAIDLDEEIEKILQKPILQIFAKEGEPFFRKIEAETLRKIPIRSQKIIATGGGTPCFHQNLDYMLGVGKVVFLDVPLSVLLERILSQKQQRPMFAQKTASQIQDFLEKLYQERLPFYKKAHFRITECNEIEKIIEDVSF